VGYRRKIARSGAVLALALSAAVRAAEPTEPLTVTRLPDAENELLTSAASDNVGTSDHDPGEFSRAVSEAVRLQQQAMQSSCQSVPTARSAVTVRWAWEARCRYQRY
jgi:hypothetical protein